jgi:PKD repeat protein
VARGLITSVVTVGCLALVLAAEATATPIPSVTVNDEAVVPPAQVTVVAGEEVTFESTSTAGVGAIIETVWDLDDNGIFGEDGEVGTSVARTFDDAGTFNVSLRVTDEDTVTTSQATLLLSIVVEEPPPRPPEANFNVSPLEPFALEPATFTSTSTAFDGATIDADSTQWDFENDGTIDASGLTVTHTFPLADSYSVRLVVEDSRGETAQIVRTPPLVVSAPRSPVPAFTVSPNTPTVGAAATFTSTSSAIPGFPISTAWFIDGAPAGNGQAVTHTFSSPGPHSVRLVVDDERTLPPVELVQTVFVNAPPVADFTAFPTSPLVGEEVNLTSDSSDDGGLAEQLWDLDGDGAFDDASGSRAKLMFTAPGNHTVSLLVRDGHGATSTVSKVITARRSTLLQPITNQPGSNSPPAKGNPGPSAGLSQPVLRLISPFPVVRLTGSVVKRGTRVRRLSVRAPAGSKVFVRCRGRGCPVKRAAKLVTRRAVRVRAFERLLRPGTLLEVLVRRGDQMGKYTSFRIRPKRVPKRIDGCLPPSASRGVTCQAD